MKGLKEVVASSHSARTIPRQYHTSGTNAVCQPSLQNTLREPHFLSKLPSVPMGWSRWTISTRSRRWFSRRLSRLSTSTRGRWWTVATTSTTTISSTTSWRRWTVATTSTTTLSTTAGWRRWSMATTSTTSYPPNPSPFYHPPTFPTTYPTSSLPNPATSLPNPTSSTNSRPPSNSPCSCRGN